MSGHSEQKSKGALELEAAIDARGLRAVSASLGVHSWVAAAWASGSTRPLPRYRSACERVLGIDARSWSDAWLRRSDSEGARQLRAIIGECGRGGAVTIARRLGTSDSAVRTWAVGTKVPVADMRARLRDVCGIPLDAWPAGGAARRERKEKVQARKEKVQARKDRAPTRAASRELLRQRIGSLVLYDDDGPGEEMVVRQGTLLGIVELPRSSALIDDQIEKALVRLPCGDVREPAVSRVRPESGEPSRAALAWARDCARGRDEGRRAVLARVYAEQAYRERERKRCAAGPAA